GGGDTDQHATAKDQHASSTQLSQNIGGVRVQIAPKERLLAPSDYVVDFAMRRAGRGQAEIRRSRTPAHTEPRLSFPSNSLLRFEVLPRSSRTSVSRPL